MTNDYEEIDEDFEIVFKEDILTRSIAVVIINTVTEAGAEIHFEENGNVSVAYLRSGDAKNNIPV